MYSLLLSTAFAKSHHHKAAATAQTFPGSGFSKTDTCNAPPEAKKVYILKQWHLPPTTATKGFKEKYPQEKNQTAIYKALDSGVRHKDLQLIVSEGCEGEINSAFTLAFNGWDFASLKAQAQQKNFEKIITLAPLKVAAKEGDKVPTLCGDSDALIQEGNLHLSNLRGWMGFYVRLGDASADADKVKLYSDSAADLLKVPKETPREKLVPQIKDRIKEELDAFRKTLNERDDAFVKVLAAHDFSKAALVIGGLHADDLKEKIEKAGMNCEVLEPPGYQREDEKLVQDFQKAMNPPSVH